MPDTTRDDARDKRQAILSAARELFARRGYEETTIAEIARAAGVAVGPYRTAATHILLMSVWR